MEFFGITYYGPQNYIKDRLRCDYKEPMSQNEVKPLMDCILKCSTCPDKVLRPDVNVPRKIDCYMGRVNGFAYGSSSRFNKMKEKGVHHPPGPFDMYRLPPTTSTDYGWWLCDPALTETTWQFTLPRYPAPKSPNTLILDEVRKNDKYASFF